MVYPPATSKAGAKRSAIIQLEQFKEASSKPAQLKAFSSIANVYGHMVISLSWAANRYNFLGVFRFMSDKTLVDPHHAEGLVYPKVLAKKPVTDFG
jgi:hypothetical protein